MLELIQDCDIIGFSVLAQFYEPLADLSSFLRNKVNIPIVWGGIHATMYPESCLDYADIVAIGDGEDTLLDIVHTLSNAENLDNIEGIMFRDNGQTIRTNYRQPDRNLDRCPPLDFSFKDHFWVDATPGQENVLELTPAAYRNVQKKYSQDLNGENILLPYKTVATRGCPYTCTYCSIGSQDKKLFPFRSRSVENVIDELQQVMASYGDLIDVISFSDDTFLTLSEKWIANFCDLYVEKIQSSFRVIGYPLNITSTKITRLTEAGCIHFGMGVESLSKKVLYECYNRKTPVARVIEAANILVEVSKTHHIHPPTFDIILGNPYETPLDTLESFEFLTRINSPHQFVRYNLCLFPGSNLYVKAVEDGIIDQNDVTLYRSWYINMPDIDPYLNILHKLLTKYRLPSWFLRLLAKPGTFRLVKLLFRDNPTYYNSLYKLFKTSHKALRKFQRSFSAHKSEEQKS